MLALLGVWFAITWWRKQALPRSKWFLRAVVAAGPLALVALICGWITTEVGRQPWVVYEVLRTKNAVTNAGGLPIVFFAMLVVYTVLVVLAVLAIRQLGREREHA
jgi:cytochrome d ubiquinol oxidase subunit I